MNNKNKKIVLFMVYYGLVPNYFSFWLESVKNNPTINFLLISDCIEQKGLPENVKLHFMTFEQLKRKLQSKFNFKISLKNPARISQFRPAFAYIFPEIVKEYDFWGFVECDLILGDIRKFITDDLLERYDKFFKLGHLQLFRNTQRINQLFMTKTPKALNYKFAFSRDILFFEELLGMHNISTAVKIPVYTKNVFSDLSVPELMFMRTTYGYEDEVSSEEELFEYEDGKLYCYYWEKEKVLKREILYVHFQKRAMDIAVQNTNRYIIVPNEFSPHQIIDEQLFDKIHKKIYWRKKNYRDVKKQNFQTIKAERLKQKEWRLYYIIRFRVLLFGGTDVSGLRWKR